MNTHSLTKKEGGNNAVALRLGAFELLVLLAVIDSRPYAYGITIRDAAVRRRDGIDVHDGTGISLGAVYATLDRLERKKHLVRSWRGDPTPERGGRSKRFFELTALGEASVQRSLDVFNSGSVAAVVAT
jgi:PadR family transcriptional regulator PadR